MNFELWSEMKFDFDKYRSIYTADFETSTPLWYDRQYQKDNYNITHVEEEHARIWAWDLCAKRGDDYIHATGTNMLTFMQKISRLPLKAVVCFHNLAFDGSYILSWLLEKGFECITEGRPRKFQFQTCISDMGQHYAYEINFGNGHEVVIMDSLKYIMASVRDIAIMYNLPILKGECDYNRYRYPDEPISDEDLLYIRHDTEIMARAISLNIAHGQIKFTQAGNAKYEFKKSIKQNPDLTYEILFPELSQSEDDFMRKAYNGGFTYVNPLYQGKDLGDMISMDYNSMYPSQMLFRPMPYGDPIWGKGKYGEVSNFPKHYNLYIQHFACRFILKDKGVPMIPTKKLFLTQPDAYMRTSSGKQVELYLSSPDMELFFANYIVTDIEYIDFCAFRSKQGKFISPEEARKMSVDEIILKSGEGSIYHDYFLKWRYIKEHAEKGSTERAIAKRMQNALYGAEACNPYRMQNIPYLDDNGVLKYKVIKADDGQAMYLPAAIFTTSWSRYDIISAIMANIDRFVYCDTDSLYLLGHTVPRNINIHDSLYGFFKIEHIIIKARFLGPKRYIYYAREPNKRDYKWEIACCGASEAVKKQMCWTNFKPNRIFDGKLTMKTVKGGKHLVETTYKLSTK